MGILGSLTERQRRSRFSQADSVAQLPCRAKGGGSWSLICPVFRAIICQDNPRHICILWYFWTMIKSSFPYLSYQWSSRALRVLDMLKTLLEQILFSSFHLEHITAYGSYGECGWMDKLRKRPDLNEVWSSSSHPRAAGQEGALRPMAGFGTLVLW